MKTDISDRNNVNIELDRILSQNDTEVALQKARPFMELMMHYNCAIKEVTTKFEVLNAEFSVIYDRNPVQSIKSRLKSPLSILGKMRRKEYPVTAASMRENVNDIAGVRVICAYPKDIYDLAEMFLRQDDIRLIEKKDYIANPKSNGYRSLHLIVEVPIFLTRSTEYMRVEVQLRTIAMDFWASLEHQLRYKKEIDDDGSIAAELKYCAEAISELDNRMQSVHDRLSHSV